MDDTGTSTLAHNGVLISAPRPALRSMNPLERLDREVKRCTDVEARAFHRTGGVMPSIPNEDRAISWPAQRGTEAGGERLLQCRYMQIKAMADPIQSAIEAEMSLRWHREPPYHDSPESHPSTGAIAANIDMLQIVLGKMAVDNVESSTAFVTTCSHCRRCSNWLRFLANNMKIQKGAGPEVNEPTKPLTILPVLQLHIEPG